MKILQEFLQGKRTDQSLCEDGWVVTPDFAAVVDGSTSKVAGRHGGREAMRIVCEAIRTLPPDADRRAMLQMLTAALASHLPPEAATDAAWRLTCSAVVFSRRRRVVWMVGDCQCRFGGTTHTNGKLVDQLLTQMRCDIVHHLLQHGHSAEALRRHDLGRDFIQDALKDQTNFQNDPDPLNPYAYAVLDGTAVDERRVPELAVPPSESTLILTSDGYPVVLDTLEESERELQRLLHDDPLCIGENAGTKGWAEGNLSFDDRCYVKLQLDD